MHTPINTKTLLIISILMDNNEDFFFVFLSLAPLRWFFFIKKYKWNKYNIHIIILSIRYLDVLKVHMYAINGYVYCSDCSGDEYFLCAFRMNNKRNKRNKWMVLKLFLFFCWKKNFPIVNQCLKFSMQIATFVRSNMSTLKDRRT